MQRSGDVNPGRYQNLSFSYSCVDYSLIISIARSEVTCLNSTVLLFLSFSIHSKDGMQTF